MAKSTGYNTGGKHAPKGLAAHGGHANSTACDPSRGGAGMGTAANNPNTQGSGPGGTGSTGSASSSSAS